MRFLHFAGFMAGVFLALPAGADTPIAWTYDEDGTGQDEWGILSSEYVACESGTGQSPIDISRTQIEAMPPLDMRFPEGGKGRMRFHGHAVEIVMEGEPEVRTGGITYHLKRIRFHTPGEHTIRDKFYPLEIEMFYESRDGKLMITSVLVEIGEENRALQSVVEHLPGLKDESVPVTFDVPSLLPASRDYYAYTGSLTIPPCTEGVEWRIFKQPVMLSREQLVALAKRIGRNARLIQPAYMRTVRENEP